MYRQTTNSWTCTHQTDRHTHTHTRIHIHIHIHTHLHKFTLPSCLVPVDNVITTTPLVCSSPDLTPDDHAHAHANTHKHTHTQTHTMHIDAVHIEKASPNTHLHALDF